MTFNLSKSAKFIIGGLLILATSVQSVKISSHKDFTKKILNSVAGPKIRVGHSRDSKKQVLTYDIEKEIYSLFYCQIKKGEYVCTNSKEVTAENMAELGLTKEQLETLLLDAKKKKRS